MDHITAALDGVSEARLQVLLGLPLMPWSLRGRRAPARPDLSARDADRRWCATGCPTAAPTISSARLIRALNERFEPDEALALAVDNAATFYLAGHETTANAITWTLFLLSEQPELQDEAAAEAQAALAAGEDDAGPARAAAAAAPDPRGIDAPLSAGAALRPPGGRRRPARRAGGRRPATSSRSGPGCSTATARCGTIPTPSIRTASRPSEGRAPPLPVSPVRRRPAPLRRRPLRDGRGADRARALARAAGRSRRCRAARCASRAWSRCGRRAACR